MVVKFYYEKVFDLTKRSTTKLQECMEKAVEQVKKDHYSAFYKQLVCDQALSPDFLKEIQVHYDMNLEPEMLIEKLQMLAYSYVIPQHKFFWLK